MSARRPLAVILHGPGGAGKDEVVRILTETMGFVRPTSSNTRPPRPDEIEGEHYHFLSDAEFEQKIAAGELIEYARVHGFWKGIERREVAPRVEAGADIVIRTDVQGARAWRELMDGTVSILLRPESREKLAEQARGRGDSDAEIAVRLDEFDRDIAPGPHIDYTVTNLFGQFENTARIVRAIVEFERHNPARPAYGFRAG